MVLNELFGADRQLKLVVSDGASLSETPLPDEIRPIPLKIQMIELLASDELGPFLTGSVGTMLFRLFLEREDFADVIVATFKQRPKEAVETLLGMATDLKSQADNQERQRAEKAADLILGRPAAVPEDVPVAGYQPIRSSELAELAA